MRECPATLCLPCSLCTFSHGVVFAMAFTGTSSERKNVNRSFPACSLHDSLYSAPRLALWRYVCKLLVQQKGSVVGVVVVRNLVIWIPKFKVTPCPAAMKRVRRRREENVARVGGGRAAAFSKAALGKQHSGVEEAHSYRRHHDPEPRDASHAKKRIWNCNQVRSTSFFLGRRRRNAAALPNTMP